MATTSTSFTATGQSASHVLQAAEEDLTVSISGSWVGTIQLERMHGTSGLSWELISGPYTSNQEFVYPTTKRNETYRLRCTAFTSGTIVTTMADPDLIIQEIKDDFGNVLGTYTQAGFALPGTLTVTGVSTFTGVQTFTGDATFSSTITVAGAAIFSDTIAVTGIATYTAAIVVNDTTASTTGTTGSIQTDGGIGAALDIVTDETFKPLGATSNSDAAAVGYEAAKGIVITGQGSTNDVTIENDAGVEVLGVLTGSTIMAHAGVFEPSRTQAVSNGALESGVTAVYYGDGLTTTAVLTLTNVVLTVGDNASLGSGVLIFTLPAGNLTILDASHTVAISGIDDSDATPDVGIGTVVAVGAVTALGGTSTFENIIFGTAAADCNGTATVSGGRDPANFGAGFQVLTGENHTVFWNQAGAYSDETDFVGVINGTVVITYRYNFA